MSKPLNKADFDQSGVEQELLQLSQINLDLLMSLEGVEVDCVLNGEETKLKCVKIADKNIFFYETAEGEAKKFFSVNFENGEEGIMVVLGEDLILVEESSSAEFLSITQALMAQAKELSQDGSSAGERENDQREEEDFLNESGSGLGEDPEEGSEKDFDSTFDGAARKEGSVNGEDTDTSNPLGSESPTEPEAADNSSSNPTPRKGGRQEFDLDFLKSLDGTEIDYSLDGQTVPLRCEWDKKNNTIHYKSGDFSEFSVDFIEDEDGVLVPTLHKQEGVVLQPVDQKTFRHITQAFAEQAVKNKEAKKQTNKTASAVPPKQPPMSSSNTNTKQEKVAVEPTAEEQRKLLKLQNKATLALTLTSLADGAYTKTDGAIFIKSFNADGSITIDELDANKELHRSVYKFKKDSNLTSTANQAVIGIDKNKSKRGDSAQDGSPTYQSSSYWIMATDKMRNDDIVADEAKFQNLTPTPTPNLIDIFKQKLSISNTADCEKVNIHEYKPKFMLQREQKVTHQFSFDKDNLVKGEESKVVLSNMEILDAIYLVSKSQQNQVKDASRSAKIEIEILPIKAMQSQPGEVPSNTKSPDSTSQQSNNLEKSAISIPIARKMASGVVNSKLIGSTRKSNHLDSEFKTNHPEEKLSATIQQQKKGTAKLQTINQTESTEETTLQGASSRSAKPTRPVTQQRASSSNNFTAANLTTHERLRQSKEKASAIAAVQSTANTSTQKGSDAKEEASHSGPVPSSSNSSVPAPKQSLTIQERLQKAKIKASAIAAVQSTANTSTQKGSDAKEEASHSGPVPSSSNSSVPAPKQSLTIQERLRQSKEKAALQSTANTSAEIPSSVTSLRIKPSHKEQVGKSGASVERVQTEADSKEKY